MGGCFARPLNPQRILNSYIGEKSVKYNLDKDFRNWCSDGSRSEKKGYFLQFLIESVIICIVGGLCCVGIGVIAAGITVPLFRLEPRFEFLGAGQEPLFPLWCAF